MKDRLFFDDEFEKQLKEKADQFKMYPSDNVWSEVYSSIHTRRRRFVAGMTFLIGGILILAGTQLIFPTKNTLTKTVALKPGDPVKPSTEAGFRDFTAGSLDSPAPDISGNSQDAGNGLNTSSSFKGRYEEFNNQKYAAGLSSDFIHGNIETNTYPKIIQPEELNLSEKSNASLAAAEKEESIQIASIVPVLKPTADDLAPEKTLTQLSHDRNDRFSWEIYIAPTLNTHYLNGINYQAMSQSVRNAPIMVVHVANVNGFVDNTPAMGYAIGGNLIYRLTRNISLKAGVEFSFNRYYIKVYNPTRNAAASLNSYLGYVADSLVNPFSPDISANKNPQHFQNKYYQISVPVGLEMKVAGNGKLQLHLGANLQPSYLLNTDAYVLSSDYSRYTQDAQAFRRWNLIAGAEAFVSYGTGKLRWELGPQVRYQIFSTYKNSYPLQENMLNYGIRIGISKTIR